jgi:hypothetical protein
VTHYTFDELADLRTPQREETLALDLLDGENVVLDTLRFDKGHAPRISNDVSRATKRTLTGLVLPPLEEAKIDPLSHRVRARWVMPEASDNPYVGRALGVFLFQQFKPGGDTLATANLHDQGLLFATDRGEPFGIAQGDALSGAIGRIVAEVPAPEANIEPSGLPAPSAMGWPPNTTRAKILDDLCAALSYWWYFDAHGVFRAHPAIDPALVEPTLRYDVHVRRSRIARGSMEENFNFLDAPNVYVVVGSGPGQTQAVGKFYIPDSAPHSVSNRGGREVVDVQQVQGISNSQQAQFAAYLNAITDTRPFKQATLDATVDPRLDTYDVVGLAGGEKYLCTGWDLTGKPGGPHSLTLSHKAWQL